MTIYNKNGSMAVTIVQRLTTQVMQALNNTNATVNVPNSGNIQLDDEDDFVDRNKWKSVEKMVQILYNLSTALAVISSLVGMLLFLTILDRNLREKSQMWYLYHLTALSVFAGLILHTASHAGILNDSRQACYFIMYGAEYVTFGLGMNVILINIEVIFTKILNLEKWASNSFYRFLTSILFGWLIVCMVIAHVIINNNSASENTFCFMLKQKSLRTARVVLRSLVPCVVCFLITFAALITYYLKRSRITFTTMSGELKEIRTEGRNDESQWLRCVIFMNIVFFIREIAMVVLYFKDTIQGPDEYKWIIFVIFVHVQAMYTVPFCMFFIEDVRMSLKTIAMKVLQKISFGKLRLGDDLESLAVSFGNPSHSDNS
ncbi:uncharacterized protein LOC123532451 [Mercenaria mercenaria]|uniref:uncharacterized protein LOC123532451 n=1 Tax=Mercenaria mercenaria TaxID=6596 RepID=UPI00234F6FE0|nr:uncharacterized protein LOC123532451 [Mercenaria mercenaria]